MDKELFKDALYAPEICKLMLTLKIGKIHFKVVEPYVMTISIPNFAEAKEFLERVGLADLPFACLEDRFAPDFDLSLPPIKVKDSFVSRAVERSLLKGSNKTTDNKAQEPLGSRGTVYGLLKSAGSFGGDADPRHGSHPDGFGSDCHKALENNQCPLCAYQPGDDAPQSDYPWLHASKDAE